MVTTRRSSEVLDTLERGNAVDLLERSTPKSYVEYTTTSNAETKDLAEARERMRRNLDKIMGYDRVEEVVEQPVSQATEYVTEESDVDIEPSKTTLQFVSENLDEIYDEIRSHTESKVVKTTFTKKQKLIIALVAFTATVMLTLIMLNASLIASFAKLNSTKAANLSAKQVEYNSLMSEIDKVSSNDYIIDVAKNELGMIKGN